jgi:ankyrin repeat protein
MACANGFEEIVAYLIEKGAALNSSNKSGNTPLHWACLNGKKEIVDLLMAQKVPTEEKD